MNIIVKLCELYKIKKEMKFADKDIKYTVTGSGVIHVLPSDILKSNIGQKLLRSWYEKET